MRDLADLLVDLGVFEHRDDGGDERWRFPNQLQLPDEVLPFPADFVSKLDAIRFDDVAEPYAQRIIRHIIDDLNSPTQVWTTMVRLARATDLEPEAVRYGLALLVKEGDFRVTREKWAERRDESPETLPVHARFVLLIDWQKFAETRISIRRSSEVAG